MNQTALGILLLLLSLFCGVIAGRLFLRFYFPELTPIKCLRWFLRSISMASQELKLLLKKQPIENFLVKNWRTLALSFGILWGWFVWPTPYKQLPLKGMAPQRENRLTGEVQWWDDFSKRWK
jgi:hypothetical protein